MSGRAAAEDAKKSTKIIAEMNSTPSRAHENGKNNPAKRERLALHAANAASPTTPLICIVFASLTFELQQLN